MVQAQIIIPLQDNDGKPTPERIIERWCRFACAVFSGATFHRKARGYWTGADRNYDEAVGVLEMDYDGSAGLRAEVMLLAREIKRALKQESVYVRFVPIEGVLV